MPDDLTAALDALRRPAAATVEAITKHGWTSEDDAWDQIGPMGIGEWHALQSARKTLLLLRALDAVLTLADSIAAPHAPARSIYEAGYCDAESQLGKVFREEISRALAGGDR